MIRKQRRTIAIGDDLPPESWLGELAAAGYVLTAQAAGQGQFAHRGGIIDVFPYNASAPYRVEFFGDRVDSIRVFDPDSQASTRTIDSFEMLGEPGDLLTSTLINYLPENTSFMNMTEEHVALHASRFTLHEPTKSHGTRSDLDLYGLDVLSDTPLDPLIQESRRDLFLKQMRQWLDQEWDLRVFCNNEGEEQRLREILKEQNFPLKKMAFRIGPLLRGFSFPKGRLAVITDAEIFGRYQTLRALKRQERLARSRTGRASIDFQDLSLGDLVVHVEHGIGKFIEIQALPGGAEVLVLEFANEARLYVPIEQAHLVSRYVGVGKRTPALDELGGGRWEKAKIAAQKAVMDYAAQLLTLQAERATLPGHAFSPDNAWQKEFEASFLYEETPDQMTAIEQTKEDMESTRPMDRLICGDVGYGKTEVAIRAAFKAVMDGKQVAVLVPTTVLAQQHYETFRQRMADYPVHVDVLSRFRSKKDQGRIVTQARDGKIDILIGTHRLLSRDIRFKDLGLAVIDEEQRFGVLHKEKFKQLFKRVDVLTLSATPIPRTLYLSLVGARDMSTIETPPRNRLPIETMICPFDERILRDAITREMARNGQVFLLHNRVGSIQGLRDRVRKLVPKAKVDIGHGQMPEDELEEVMKRFVEGKTDVLVSTTIIESGLDIPNANTIIIDRADRFGLADLYQLRGRVGRSNQKAYAYLMLPRDQLLSAGPRKRVSAIKQYSSLGAGFKVAMRDLEIRGAGNILGTAQSGHVAAVGFDLYCKLNNDVFL
jgi:transcription-repair coupling factor (superfamily II helicase)